MANDAMTLSKAKHTSSSIRVNPRVVVWHAWRVRHVKKPSNGMPQMLGFEEASAHG
jgi:hypothetical protein